MARPTLALVGLGYTGSAIAERARRAGWEVVATARDPAAARPPAGVVVARFADPGWLAAATHLVVTAPPGEAGDPVWAAHEAALAAAPLCWVGYISTTGVYGDRGGGWVEEATPPAPGQPRSLRRREAERQWETLATRAAVDLFRTGGIYGPGRSALDEVRAGTARRIVRPGHAFSRIHRDDIARAVLAAAARPPAPGVRVLHLVDDEPAEPARVVEEACRLLGVPPPPAIPFAEAWAAMSPMARSFWAENRRVANAATKRALGLDWAFPSFREGLAAILAGERAEDAAEQREVGGR